MTTTRVIPSITTHNKVGSTWRDKVGELIQLNISEVGLFVTGLSRAERKECLRLLCYVREQHYFTIPFVHAVSDMADDEYTLFREVFKTEWFNLHPMREFPLLQPLSAETRSRILIENSCFVEPLMESDLDGFAGICIDLSHLQDARLAAPECFARNLNICRHFPVLANHISGIKKIAERVHKGTPAHSDHIVSELSELAYLQSMPCATVSPLAALELENTLEEQIELVSIVKHHLTIQEERSFDLAA